jgi:STE24 endopeptidase
MSRILLLILFLLWLSAAEPVRPLAGQGVELLLFLGVFLGLVLVMGLWSRLLARRLSAHNLRHSLNRFNRVMAGARMMIPAWFAFGLFGLQWHQIVENQLPFLRSWESALLLVGISPALLAWMGLWWSQYPADRALREQNLLIQLNADLPIQSPPGFASYFAANLRLQLLFTVVPILLIIFLSDVASLAARPLLHHVPSEAQQAVINIISAAAVFIFAPQILRYVLDTQTLPDSPLRRRLHAMCQRFGLRYRDILLWRTQNNMGNAAVVGIVPGLRYILLSDLLLETMSDDQIEAVFAHELGHIVHRHMIWYVVFFIGMILALAGPGDALGRAITQWIPTPDGNLTPSMMMQLTPLLLLGLGIAAFLIVFGFLSRRFERQADVFAARTMEQALAAEPLRVAMESPHPRPSPEDRPSAPRNASSPVGPRGAAVFASALERVAVINNIPIAARSWCHGSIARRMNYLLHLARDPQRTGHFDRTMVRLYALLLAACAACVAYLLFIHP